MPKWWRLKVRGHAQQVEAVTKQKRWDSKPTSADFEAQPQPTQMKSKVNIPWQKWTAVAFIFMSAFTFLSTAPYELVKKLWAINFPSRYFSIQFLYKYHPVHCKKGWLVYVFSRETRTSCLIFDNQRLLKSSEKWLYALCVIIWRQQCGILALLYDTISVPYLCYFHLIYARITERKIGLEFSCLHSMLSFSGFSMFSSWFRHGYEFLYGSCLTYFIYEWLLTRNS